MPPVERFPQWSAISLDLTDRQLPFVGGCLYESILPAGGWCPWLERRRPRNGSSGLLD
jgi:hypothetical protein